MLISLKGRVDALSVPPQLVFEPTLANYSSVFATVYEFPSVIINSIVIAGIGTLIILLLAVPAAYGLSRLLPLGRDTMSFGIISARTFPYDRPRHPALPADAEGEPARHIRRRHHRQRGLQSAVRNLDDLRVPRSRSRSSWRRRPSSTAVHGSVRWCEWSSRSSCPGSARPRS